MRNVRLGVTLPQFTDDPNVFLDAARRADAIGLDSVWVFDHMWPLTGGKERPALECWTTLAWLAAATKHIGIGTLVTRSSLRYPAVLAKMAATVAAIAPGRVTVTIGSGDALNRDENAAFGIPYYAGKERDEQLAATIETVRSHLHAPRPESPDSGATPPVWVAGRSDAICTLAGRLADGWNGWGRSAADFARDAATVQAAAAGREVTLTWAGLVVIGQDDAAATAKLKGRGVGDRVVGGPATVAGHLAALIEAGASHLICTFPDAGAAGPYELLAGPVRRALGLR
jgi:alkanesulfonate monooxygenase SsuD/methylene tetrahydromethanopterin reductase-like flavin-dependent oxidoreductase (luciferase family)